jgi:hypothetical protein
LEKRPAAVFRTLASFPPAKGAAFAGCAVRAARVDILLEGGETTMADQGSVDPAARSAVAALLENLNLILTQLLNVSRASSDPVKLLQIANEMSAIQTLINQAAQAQAAATDTMLAAATTSLKTQSTMLQEMEAHITKIVDDANTAGQIVGYIAQALVVIAKL